MPDFAGRWYTTFGPMDLKQKGKHVQGVYHFGPAECSIEGNIEGERLNFRYQEPAAAGEGWFDLKRHGKFVGQWRPDGDPRWGFWVGERGFEGIWESSFGRLRLIQEPDRVVGSYEALGDATIEGRLHGNHLVFRYREPTVAGDGQFELDDSGQSFAGQWKPEHTHQWMPWLGRRIHPQLGLVWLVVLEAHWQQHLNDKEYSFGNMLKEFFARVDRVQVRHRFFSNDSSLTQWCRSLRYLAEPSVVLVATHGTPEGLAVHGQTITPQGILESLKFADNIQLLHFSTCLLMKDGPAHETLQSLQKTASFPISGYTTAVDWAASAILEFTYLDLILSRGYPPAAAAEQMLKLLPFAGDHADPESAFPAAGFRIMLPD